MTLQNAEDQKQAQAAIKELYQLIKKYSDWSRLIDPFGTKAIKHFVALDSFDSLKRNLFFIEGLAEVIYFNNAQIKIIKGAFDLTDSATFHTSHGDLHNALIQLDTKLELRRRKNTNILKSRIPMFVAVTAFVAFMVWGLVNYNTLDEMMEMAQEIERPPVVTTYLDEVIHINLPWERGYIEATNDRELRHALTRYVNRRAEIYVSEAVGRNMRGNVTYDLASQNINMPTWVTFVNTLDSNRQARVRIQLHFR